MFLYTLCNLAIVPDSMTIWTCLLSHIKRSTKAKDLVDEILCYRKTYSATATLKTSLLLSDAVTIMVANNNVDTAIQYSFYLTAVLNDLVAYGFDPRPGFRIIRQAVSEIKHSDNLTWNVFLILLNQSLHNVSPVYLSDVVRLLKVLLPHFKRFKATTLTKLFSFEAYSNNAKRRQPIDSSHDFRWLNCLDCKFHSSSSRRIAWH